MPVPNFNAENDCEALRKAMRGMGKCVSILVEWAEPIFESQLTISPRHEMQPFTREDLCNSQLQYIAVILKFALMYVLQFEHVKVSIAQSVLCGTASLS